MLLPRLYFFSGLITERVNFVILHPSTLIFFSGQSIGDVQCTSVTILDDSIPQGERNVSISISRSGISNNESVLEGYRIVHVHTNRSSVTFTIELDVDDCRFSTFRIILVIKTIIICSYICWLG